MIETIDDVKFLDVSGEQDDMKKSRRIITHIYSIRNLLLDGEIDVLSLMVNKKLLGYIKKYNFVFLKSNFRNQEEYENNQLVGYLMNMKIIYSNEISEDMVIFNTNDSINTLNIKINI